MCWKGKILLCLSLIVPIYGWAHDEQFEECHAPVRPLDEQNDVLWEEFLTATDVFRDCTRRHMEWHQSAVVTHQTEARSAVEQWNEFVRTSLNAPEDYPWPATEEAE